MVLKYSNHFSKISNTVLYARQQLDEEDTGGNSGVSGVLSASMSGEIKFGIVFVVPQENTPMYSLGLWYITCFLTLDFQYSQMILYSGERVNTVISIVSQGVLSLNPFSVIPSNVTQIMLSYSCYRKTPINNQVYRLTVT